VGWWKGGEIKKISERNIEKRGEWNEAKGCHSWKFDPAGDSASPWVALMATARVTVMPHLHLPFHIPDLSTDPFKKQYDPS